MPHPSPSTGHRSFRAGAVFGILLVTILLLHFSVVDAGLRHRAENREGHSTEGRKHRQREYHKHDDRNHHRRQVDNDGDTGDTKRTDCDRNHNRKQDTRHQSLQKKHGKEKYFHLGDSTGAADGKPPSVNDGRSKSTDTNSRNEPRSNMDRLAQQLRESRRNKNRSPDINVDHPVDQPEAVATTNTVRRPHAQSKQNQQQNSQAPPTFLSFVLDPVVVTILVLAFTANVLNSSTSTIDSAELENMEKLRRDLCEQILQQQPRVANDDSEESDEEEIALEDIDELLDSWDPEFDIGSALHDYEALRRYTDYAVPPPLLSGSTDIHETLNNALNHHSAQLAIASSVREELVRTRGGDDSDNVLEMARHFEILHSLDTIDRERASIAAPVPGDDDWVVVDPLCQAVSGSTPRVDGHHDDGGDSIGRGEASPPPGYTDASALPEYCEEIVLGVVRENGDDELARKLRVPVQEMIEGQVRLTKKHLGEIQELSERLAHDAEEQADVLRREISDADRRHADHIEELKRRQTQGMEKLKTQIKDMRTQQQKKLLEDFSEMHVKERSQHLDRLYYRGSATLWVCAVAVTAAIMSEVFNKTAESDNVRDDLLLFAKCFVLSLAAAVHTLLGKFAGNGGFVLSGCIALGVLAATKSDELLSMWLESHFLLLALTLPAFWYGLMLRMTTHAYTHKLAAINANEWSASADDNERAAVLESAFAWPRVAGVDTKSLVDGFAIPALQYLIVLFGACRVACQCQCLELLTQ